MIFSVTLINIHSEMIRYIKMLRLTKCLGFLVIFFCISTQLLYAQNISNKGTDFWVGYGHHQFMENAEGSNNQNMVLYISTEDQAAIVTVTIDSSGPAFPIGSTANWWRRTYNIAPYSVISTGTTNATSNSSTAGIVGPMPKKPTASMIIAGTQGTTDSYDCRLWNDPAPAGNGGNGFFRKKAIHIESNVPIVVYAHIYGSVSSGATMLLPVESWGYSYTTINSQQGNNVAKAYNFAFVVAKENNTVVEITPTANSRPGFQGLGSTVWAANTPFQVTLQKGWIYQYIAESDDATGTGPQLTGTRFKSIVGTDGNCHPIAVFAGSSRTAGEYTSCGSAGRDNDIQQCLPEQTWGKQYLTTPFSIANSSSSLIANSFMSSVYKVVVKDPTTIVKLNGTVLTGLINNKYYQFKSNTADNIEADKPIMVGQFMSNGSQCDGGSALGDPEMVYLSPLEQSIKQVYFYRNTLESIAANYVSLSVPISALSSLKIDNVQISTSTLPTSGSNVLNVYNHPNKSGYKVVVRGWPAAQSQVSIKCDSGFTAITYGLGSAESYAFSAGAQLNNLSGFPAFHNSLDTSSVLVNHPYTFTNTPVQIGANIIYKPTKIVWKFSSLSCSVVNPCTDYIDNNPLPIDSSINGSGKLYLYRVPGNHIFNTAGTYYLPIELTSPNSDNTSCSNVETIYIEIIVKDFPTFDFYYTHTFGCTMDSVRFTSDSVTPQGYSIIRYKWTFPNGDTSNLQNPAYLFAAGTYQVKLTVITQYGGVTEVTKPVNVVSGGQPYSNFGANPSTVCLGQTIVCTDSTNYSGTTGWYWDFGNGQTINATTNANQSITYTAAGTYIIKHTLVGSGSSFPCAADTVRRTVIVLVSPVITSATPNSPAACGGTNGSIVLNGLTASVSYVVNYTYNGTAATPITLSANSSGVITIPNLSAGTYTNITVTIGTCTSAPIATVVLNNPNAPTAPAISSNSPICAGATLNLTSGISIATVTYEWIGPNGFTSNLPNPTINPATTAAAGTYSLIVKDIISGCSSVATTTNVVVNAIPLIGSTSSSNPTTCATATGSITLDGLLSNILYNVNYTYNSITQNVNIISNASGQVIISGLASGTYSNITVALNTCKSSAVGPISLSDPNPPATPVATVLVTPICAGNTINLSANSSTAGATFTWSGPNSFSTIGATATITSATTAASGTYSVVAKINGCTSLPGTVNVTVNPIPATPTVASNSPICAGSNLNLTSSGVTGTAIYNWTGPNTFISSNANPAITAATTVATGSYDLTVTQNGCASASGSVSVVVNAVPVITSSSLTNTTTCATATGTILLNGLLANTSYIVNYTASAINQTATIISGATGSLEIPNLLAGTYSNVSVTLNNCTSNVVGPFTIADPTPPPTPTIVSNNSPVCSGSAIVLTAGSTTTGAIFTWTTSSGTNVIGATLTLPSVTASDAGTYSVKITVNSCNSSPLTTNVVVKPTPIVSSSTSTNPTTCATATGSIILNGLTAATTYAIAYTKNGIAQTATLIANASGVVTISNLPAAIYANVTLSLNGCTSTAVGPFVLSDPNPPATPTIVSVPSATICTGNNLTLTASTTTAGTIIYNWSANNGLTPTTTNPLVFNNANASVAGTYSVTATLNSCTSAAGQVTVVVNPTPVITTGTITNPTDCASTTGGIILNGLTNNTTYTVTYTINASVQTVTLTSNASGVITIPSLGAGTYSNISVTLNGCPSNIVGPFTLTDPAPPGVSIVTNNSPLCEGATLNIVASSAVTGVSFAWTSTNGYTNVGSIVSINPVTTLSSGTYTVTAIKNNCASTANAVVSVNPYPITAFTTSPFVCMPNGVVSFTNLTTVPDGSTPTYVWNFGDGSPVDNSTNPTHIYTSSNTYTISLTATGGNGCSKTISKQFDKFYDKPMASFKVDKDTLCLGPISMFKDLSTAPNSSIKSWLWDFADGTTSTLQDPNKKFNFPGSYNVRLIVRSQENCVSDTSKKQIRVYQQPIIDAGSSFTVPVGTSIVFNPTANDSTVVSFLWTPSSHFVKADTLRPTLIVKGNQIYYLTAKGEWKCTASDSLKVIALKLLKVPNAFTPNGDNIHDKWEIDELRDFPFAEVEVFNRNGQLVYHSSGYSNPWDGTLNGKSLPIGTYYYIIDLKNNFPKQAGFVTLLR